MFNVLRLLLVWGHFLLVNVLFLILLLFCFCWVHRQFTILHYFFNYWFILMLCYKNVEIMIQVIKVLRILQSAWFLYNYMYGLLTTLPASLLCKFIMYRKSLPFSKTSTNFRENLWPNLALSLHPPHSQSFPLGCFRL